MNNSIKVFKEKLKQLTGLLENLNASSSQVAQLKKSVYVLNKLLENEDNVIDPYGPHTAIVRYSLN